MDEAHYFQDPERGHAWEETLILLPPAVKLVLLSATIAAPPARTHPRIVAVIAFRMPRPLPYRRVYSAAGRSGSMIVFG
jgi:hypothetical protein